MKAGARAAAAAALLVVASAHAELRPEWELGAGYCGKGQAAKVDAGGPHIRCLATLAGNSPGSSGEG